MPMRLDKKALGALAVAALGVYLVAPKMFAAALPLLIFAACPLSMLLMMRMMAGAGGRPRGATPSAADTDAELAELRAEIEHLRADRPDDVTPVAPRVEGDR